jgi:hypothetical protein
VHRVARAGRASISSSSSVCTGHVCWRGGSISGGGVAGASGGGGRARGRAAAAWRGAYPHARGYGGSDPTGITYRQSVRKVVRLTFVLVFRT